MESALLVATVATTVFTALETRAAAKTEESRLKLQAKLADTRALQRDVQRRMELERTVGAIKAARAGPGTGILSPTGLAFLDEANEVISIQRLREVASERQNAANFRTAAAFSRQKARMALIGGGLKVATSIFSFGAGGGFGGLGGAPQTSPIPVPRPT